MDYKPTLRLPKTAFPMKADLPKREPEIQSRWEAMDLYGTVRAARKGAPKFVFHDGPPYANGDVHIGTAMTKVLKDFIVRYHTMKGEDVPFVPGWDCHGLPIEHRVMKEAGAEARTLPPAEVRKRCRKYAEHFLDVQRRQFRRMGCLGDWDRPYLTMDPSYEAGVLSVFHDLLEKGFVTRDKRSTAWCPECATALAEAELEYHDREAPSVFVRCVVTDPALAAKFGLAQGTDLAFLVWTTTPWTLPSNLAVAVHPGIEYAAAHCRTREGRVSRNIVAVKRLGAVAEACGLVEATTAGRTVKGAELKGTTYEHPLATIMRPGFQPSWAKGEQDLGTRPVVPASYVSDEDGTGCVHTAPGHGMDDFRTGLAEGLPIFSPVDERGRYTDEVGPALAGKKIAEEANEAVLGMLRGTGLLLGEGKIRHSYAHCWRCKGPIIFRATDQWFVRVDRDQLRERALEAVAKVRWVPAWGQTRIASMLRDRPDWCISRQRAWGIPIPAFRCEACGKTDTSPEFVARVGEVVAREGADAWYLGPAHLFTEGMKCPDCGGADLVLPKDIFDVWFESGSSWRAVVQANPDLRYPSDAVLEGTDQHRGWFQLSLLPAVALTGQAPWKTVVTSGFVVDEGGEKVSKSRGGLLNADEIAKDFGADLLRLWVASIEYREDIPVSAETLRRVGDPYRRIRNTFRWILGNLHDFNPERDTVPPAQMLDADLWILATLQEVVALATRGFEEFEFARAMGHVYKFCDQDLSAFYFDFSKDRFYCEAAAGRERRSGQTAIFLVAETLCRLLAPVLVHLAEEVWGLLPGRRTESVHLADWPRRVPDLTDGERRRLGRWYSLRVTRALVAQQCEALRAGKEIGSNLEASVTLAGGGMDDVSRALSEFSLETLAAVLMVSEVMVGPGVPVLPGTVLGGVREVVRSPHPKCARCWNLRPTVGKDARFPDLCDRCAAVVASGSRVE